MAQTLVVGMFADELGHIEARDRSVAAPAASYRALQPAPKLDWGHGDWIGQVSALGEEQGRLWAVAQLHSWESLPPSDLWFSPHVEGRMVGATMTDIELRGLALTSLPASVALQPVQVIGPGESPRLGPFAAELVARGRQFCRRGDPLEIVGRPALETVWRDPGPKVVGRPPDRRADVPAGPRFVPAMPIDGRLVPIQLHGGGRVLSVR